MKGIVIISHGEMANGIKESAKLFFGDNIDQFEAICLQPGDSVETFKSKLDDALVKADNGDGVVVMADIFGGTPCNVAALTLPKDAQLIAGVNFAMVLEILARRDGNDSINAEDLVTTGLEAIKIVHTKSELE